MKSLFECGCRAFPTAAGGPDGNGMTLRDYFAAAALQGLLTCMTDTKALLAAGTAAKSTGLSIIEMTALTAYTCADAMLAERIK